MHYLTSRHLQQKVHHLCPLSRFMWYSLVTIITGRKRSFTNYSIPFLSFGNGTLKLTGTSLKSSCHLFSFFTVYQNENKKWKFKKFWIKNPVSEETFWRKPLRVVTTCYFWKTKIWTFNKHTNLILNFSSILLKLCLGWKLFGKEISTYIGRWWWLLNWRLWIRFPLRTNEFCSVCG